MMKITGAQAVIECLVREGVDLVFGYPGGQIMEVYDRLFDAPIRHILTRHEQAAVHAADGYARATGRPGVVIATSGPGATNLVTGLANAYMDSVPLVVITGQVGTHLLGTDAFQEADITGITMPITKHNYLVRDTEDLPRVFKEAFHIATTGRPGPVLIDLPKDVGSRVFDFAYPKSVELPGYKPTYHGHPRQVKAAAEAILSATRPLLCIGGGAVSKEASVALSQFLDRVPMPVTQTLMGLSAFPATHPLSLGMLGMHGTAPANYAVSQCDLLITVGMRFDDRVTGKVATFAPSAKVIHIDVDPAEIGKNVAVDIPIVGDAATVMADLNVQIDRLLETEAECAATGASAATGSASARSAKSQPTSPSAAAAPTGNSGAHGRADISSWLATVDEWRRQYPLHHRQTTTGRIKPQYVIEQICEMTKGQAIVATDVGQHQMWTAQYYRPAQQRSLITSGGLGTMGFGFPAAIGAQMGEPDQLVFLVTGDGSFQMNIQELATAVAHQLPIKIAILNNEFLGMVRQWQALFYQRRYSSTCMRNNPDFVKIAEAYGAVGLRAETYADVKATLEAAMAVNDRPVVIDFRVEREEDVWPMVPPGGANQEMLGVGGER